MQTLKRIVWLSMFTVPLHVSLAVWFGYVLGPEHHSELQPWANTLYRAHALTAAVVAVLALSAYWVNQVKWHETSLAVVVLVCVIATYLTLGIHLSIADLAAGDGLGITAFILVFLVVASQFLMRPFLSIPIYLAGLVGFFSALDTSTLTSQAVYGIYVDAIAAWAMGVLVSTTVWHQYARAVLIRRELSEKNSRLEFLASYDSMTGLMNRGEFMRLAEIELEKAIRYSTGMSFIMLDVDHFKDINDKHGHPTGDAVLQRVAKILADGVRTSDLVCRLGGEEFMVLMPHSNQDGAMALAEKLRIRLSEDSMGVNGTRVTVTASFGVITLSSNDAASLAELYSAADRALYRAKNLGRNTVTSGKLETSTRKNLRTIAG